ncbi:MAG: hypothetical protein AAGD06_19745 [Acidobacteriota bacterium]
MTFIHKASTSIKSTLIFVAAALFAPPAFGGWAEDALALQEFLDVNNTLNKTTWVGAHNAYSNDEWGYFDPNQTLKPLNLLRAGARQMEYDPHKIADAVLLCHGSCNLREKTLSDGLDQIKDFIKDNPNSVVFLKLEMSNGYSKVADKLEGRLGNFIYRPVEGEIPADSSCSERHGIEPEHMTKAKILAAGKNVIVFAGNGGLPNCPDSNSFMNWVHVGVEYEGSGWQKKFDKPDSPSDAGTYYDQGRMTLIHDPSTFNHINGGGEDQIFTPGNVDNYLAHGHNVFELFNFNGDNTVLFDDIKAKHMVWSWETNEPSGGGNCAVVNGVAGPLIDDTACDKTLRFTCYNAATDDWNVTSGSGHWEHGSQTCTSEFGTSYAYAVPTNGRQMDDLQSTISSANISSALYVNYHDRSIEGVWQANNMSQLNLSQSVAYGYPSKGNAFDHVYLIERGLLTGNLRKIKSMRLQGKDRVKGIEVTYADNSVHFEGTSEGSYTSSLNLSSAQLSSVEVCLDRHNGHDRVVYLKLTSTAGATISHGPREGTCNTYSLTGDLFGIFGSAGNGHLKSIGFDTGAAVTLGQSQGLEITAAHNPSKCIYKQSSGWANGNGLVIGDCGSDASGGNRWIYEESTGYLRAVQNPDMCIHKKYGNWDNGNPIHVWSCSAGPDVNKSWNYDASTGYISARHTTGKCLHKKYGSHWNNGNPIHLWDCSAGPAHNKSWSLD